LRLIEELIKLFCHFILRKTY